MTLKICVQSRVYHSQDGVHEYAILELVAQLQIHFATLYSMHGIADSLEVVRLPRDLGLFNNEFRQQHVMVSDGTEMGVDRTFPMHCYT